MPETIGRLLKQARSQRQLSLEEASEATHIRLHYLQALEADDYSVMPSAAQARGFLRNYSTYLEVDLDRALSDLQNAPRLPVEEVSGPLPQVDILPPPPESALSSQPTRPIRAASSAPLPPPPEPVRRARLGEFLRGLRPSKEEPQISADEAPVEAAAAQVEPQVETPSPVDAPETAEPPKPRWNPLGGLAARFRRPTSEAAPPEEEPVEETPAAESTPPAVPAPQSTDGDETAEKIFAEIGMELRRRRELLSLTPEEVDRHIHVREVFIRALERGDFSSLPSAVQTRGMLANYAAFLDLDTDALLLRYADSLQSAHRARHPIIPGSTRQSFLVRPKVPPLRTFMAGDLIFGLAVILMVVALITWALGRIFTEQAEVVTLPTAPSISDVLAGTSNPLPSQEVTLISVLPTTTPEPSLTPTPGENLEVPPPESDLPVRVMIVAVERTFMRVMIDGEEGYNGRVVPGAVYTFEATTTIEVLTGNGAGLRLTYNGRDMGLLGNFGQVANFIYTANAVVTPQPAVPPTSTATPLISLTPTLTPTVTRTPTLAPP